jgi:hypothetical protein
MSLRSISKLSFIRCLGLPFRLSNQNVVQISHQSRSFECNDPDMVTSSNYGALQCAVFGACRNTHCSYCVQNTDQHVAGGTDGGGGADFCPTVARKSVTQDS